MTVIDRAALEDSPLADLHAIASELSIDGYRRLRKEQLIDAILERQEDGAAAGETEPRGRPGSRRGAGGRPGSPNGAGGRRGGIRRDPSAPPSGPPWQPRTRW